MLADIWLGVLSDDWYLTGARNVNVINIILTGIEMKQWSVKTDVGRRAAVLFPLHLWGIVQSTNDRRRI